MDAQKPRAYLAVFHRDDRAVAYGQIDITVYAQGRLVRRVYPQLDGGAGGQDQRVFRAEMRQHGQEQEFQRLRI